MKDSKVIRWLDKYIGIGICFLFSLFHQVRGFQKQVSVQNVLILEFVEMGAAIMADASVKYIDKKLDKPNIFCLCFEKSKPAWELLNLIPQENIYCISEKNLFSFISSLFHAIYQLRKKKIDLILDFELFMRISSITAFFISRKIAGFYKYSLEGLYRGNFYDIKCSFNQNMHMSKNLLALTKTALENNNRELNYKNNIPTAEISVPEYRPNAAITTVVREKIRRIFPSYENQNLILVCPDVGPTLSIRNYPKDNFVEVINRLLDKYPEKLVLLIGVNENLGTCSYIHDKVKNKRCINFCSHTASIIELIELINFSELLISNDNGTTHFASLTSTKILALFGPETPLLYGPLGNCVTLYSHFHCSPCIMAYNHKFSNCTDNLCLQYFSPETVIGSIIKLLDNDSNSRTINHDLSYMM